MGRRDSSARPSNITPTVICVVSSVGKTVLSVKKLPEILIISTADEMFDAHTVPSPAPLRRSNGIMIQSVSRKSNILADSVHLPADYLKIKEKVESSCHEYDVIITIGGVFMGKYDYLPKPRQVWRSMP